MRLPLAGEVSPKPGERAGPLALERAGEPCAVSLAEHVLVPGASERKMGVGAVVHVH